MTRPDVRRVASAGRRNIELATRRRPGRPTVHEAIRAWFGGDFERCLDLCDAIVLGGRSVRSDVALIRARALLRLAQYRPGAAAEAEQTLRSAFITHGSLDASLTAQMLLGAACIRQGRVDEGLGLLVQAEAAAIEAHPTIRSEIALNQALAFYAQRELLRADCALDRVEPSADIIYARALEFRGWLALARVEYPDAVRWFRAALSHLQRCRREDRFVAANCVFILAVLAVEMIDLQAWGDAMASADRIDWTASGLGFQRMQLHLLTASMHELLGDPVRAFAAAREAEADALSDAFRVSMRCRRAALARDAGESISFIDHVAVARRIYASLDRSALNGEEALAPLMLAQEVAMAGDADLSRSLLDEYRARAEPSRMIALADDVRLKAFVAMVEGAVADAAGDGESAQRAYREALHVFRKIGYRRRAAIAAIRLADLTTEERYYELAASMVGHCGADAQAWLRRQLRAWKPPRPSAPPTPELTRVEREMIGLICAGLTNAEIASARGRSLYTVRNALHRMFGKLGVPSRAAFVRECIARGLYVPTNDEQPISLIAEEEPPPSPDEVHSFR